MPAPVRPSTTRAATRLPFTAALVVALFLLLTSAASAQHGTTYVATAQNASTTDPTAWSPSGIPRDGDAIVLTRATQILSIDDDIVLDDLRIEPDVNGPIIRLTGNTRAVVGTSLGIPLVLRNAQIVGTPGQGNELTFTRGVSIEGNLRIANGLTINVDSSTGRDGLVLSGGTINFVGATVGEPTPAIRLRNAESAVAGQLNVAGLDSAIRPVFSVGEQARLWFTENANVGGTAVTQFEGEVRAEGGAKLGRLEGSGRFDVRTGSTSPVVTLASTEITGGEVDFVQGPHGMFPTLTSAMPIEIGDSQIRTVADPMADQQAAPQQQHLVSSFTGTHGLENRYTPGRIDRGSAWAPSMPQSGLLVADRRVLARKEPVPGEDVPKRARLTRDGASDLVCEPGEYNHELAHGSTLGTFYRDGVEIAASVPSYRLAAADLGHRITCAALVVDVYGNEIDDLAEGSVDHVLPVDPATPTDPGTPTEPVKPTDPGTPQTPATPTAETPSATPAAPVTPAVPATTPVPTASPAAATAPRARTAAMAVPGVAAAASSPARCPTVAELTDVSSAWKLAASARSQSTLTGSATPGVWRCSVAGTENGRPVVIRSLPVLVANKQRAMLTSESAQTSKLRNPTLMSSGTQKVSARLYARGGDAKLKTRTTRFTQTVRKGANTLRFTQTVGASLPKGRYKLVVRAITADGVSAPLVQEVTIA